MAAAGVIPVTHARRPPPPGVPVSKYLRGVSRWDYWRIPAINPWTGSQDGAAGPYEFNPERVDEVGHAYADEYFRERHQAGDTNAVFDYAEADSKCWRSPWLIDQVEVFRRDGAYDTLVTLMKRYASNAGRTPIPELVVVIRKDQRVFRALVERPADQPILEAVMDISDRGLTSEADAKLIHRNYKPLYDSVVPARFTHEEFFAELTAIANRLASTD